MTWQPPARAPWVDKLVVVGHGLGDGGRSVVSLTADDLLAAASETTGLDDFGDDWFREPLRRLTTALDDEAALHLPGRLRARAELQIFLQNRLRLVDLWGAQPAIHEEQVRAPIVVTGLGRSGTTLLHELLACDPANRALLLWEAMASVPPPAVAGATDDPRVALMDAQITTMDEMVPAFTRMHENRGHFPTECIFAFAHQMSSDQFSGLYNIGSYTMWRTTVDQQPIYDWHRQMLRTLQWAAPTDRWVLKAPSHLTALPLLFATYPDAKVVITHRDPLRVVGSIADLMATLHWMHSDEVDHRQLVELMCMGLILQMDHVSAERDRGVLPEEQLADVGYHDLIADPVGTVLDLYRRWDLEVTEDFDTALRSYVDARHTSRSAGHDYRFEDTGLDLDAQRALVTPYQERFGVPSEVQ